MSDDVDPELFYDAAAAYKRESDGAAGALRSLTGALTTGNAAGSNGVGPQWATAYDSTADLAGLVASRLVNSLHNIGNLLQQNGVNHDITEAASTLNQRDADGDPITPPGETEGSFLPTPVDVPSASGGDTPEPLGWDLVKTRVTDGWPNGRPDALRSAATAWETFGHRLVDVNSAAGPEELSLTTNVVSVEIPPATQRMSSARDITTDVAAAAGDLSRAAKDYADKLQFVQDGMTRVLALLWAMVSIPKRWPPILRRAADVVIDNAIDTAVEHCNHLNAALRGTAEATITDLGTAHTSLGAALGNADGLLALTPRQVAPTPTERIRANQRKGAKAERRAGIDPNLAKTRIFPYQNDPSAGPRQRQRYRIPDELNREERVLREVKNVQRLSATSQLRDMAKWAADNGYTMVIVVDQGRTQGAEAVERTLEAQAAENGKNLDVVIDARPLS